MRYNSEQDEVKYKTFHTSFIVFVILVIVIVVGVAIIKLNE
jgi:hypothetical protein